MIVLILFLVCSLSDEGGSLEFSSVAEGELSKDVLEPADVFIVDNGKKVCVWVGSEASVDEKKNAMTYAHVSTHAHACRAITCHVCSNRTT